MRLALFASICRICNNHKSSRFPSATTSSATSLSRSVHSSTSNADAIRILKDSMQVYDDFISEAEETSLLMEIEKAMKRLRYESSHWDDAIESYRETEKSNWSESNAAIIKKVKEFTFPAELQTLPYVHILDLDKDGVIKPHIDSVKFCGQIIGGLSLLSTSIMRLVHEDNPALVADYLLKRRSLYVMKDVARYKFTHAILGHNESLFNGNEIPRQRRVSVIFRCEPIENPFSSQVK